jgi:hypothetical protein
MNNSATLKLKSGSTSETMASLLGFGHRCHIEDEEFPLPTSLKKPYFSDLPKT